MPLRPLSLDHVNLYVRNVEHSHRWYAELLGLHTQDTMYHPGRQRLRAAFLSCNPDHAHDIALFDVGTDAPGPQQGQVGLNHVAWRMASLEDLAAMYARLKERGIAHEVRDHKVSIGVYFADPDGNGLEVYYALPRSEWHRDRPFSGEGGKGRFPVPWDEVLDSQTSTSPA